MKVIITEFMDEAAVEELKAGFDTHYDAALVDQRPAMLAMLADADALIVRNRTKVDIALLDAAPGLRVVGRSASASTILTSPPAKRAALP